MQLCACIPFIKHPMQNEKRLLGYENWNMAEQRMNSSIVRRGKEGRKMEEEGNGKKKKRKEARSNQQSRMRHQSHW